ncbi:TonB-dependent receptor [Steroidobacter sp.]|uniref:TonB-dependent receptor n=1 Tax=Steroidobacter sp. TaxID=1978227 RepID=UPI001A400265|nr:TonB-dependent receptor [Steroidobacter sp.]MBL8268918.1 TonB-dependent receptor [Steroidobacter sp.]
MLKTQTIRNTLVAFAVTTALAHFNIATALADAPRAVNVSAGNLQDALESLGKQLNVDVVYPSRELQGLRTSGISGVMEPRAAFEKLIEGTQLIIKEQGNALLITSTPRAANGHSNETTMGPVRPIRLAQASMVNAAYQQTASDARATAPAPAETAAGAAESTDSLAEVVVTGSRLQRKDIEAVSPITMLSEVEIAQRGYIRTEEILMHMPQLQTFQSESGRTFVDLRGLGSQRTLVLVNGRRLQSGGYSSASADASIVPPGLIKNVEILTGGASSVYGADAVAGVVNFVMDTDFEGLKMTGSVSAFQHDNDNTMVTRAMDARGENWYAKGNSFDGEQYKLDIMAGGKFMDGAGHISAYLGIDKSSLLRMNARDYSSCALAANATCSGSLEAGDPNFIFANPVGRRTLQDDGTLSVYTDNLANWGNNLSMRHPAKRLRGGAFINYEINEHAQPYFELNFMRAETRNYYDETATFGVPASIRCDSPLLSAAQAAQICGAGGLNLLPTQSFTVNLYKRSVEGDARYWDKTYNSFRTVTGLKGEISGSWRYDVSFLYGNTTSSEQGTNVFVRSRLLNAVNLTRNGNGDIVCVSGGSCVPYMVFTPGGITQAALDYLTSDHYIDGDASTYVTNAFVSGDLPLTMPTARNPVALVLGAEYRKETFGAFYDDPQKQGDILGRTRQQDVNGAYEVKEYFVEAAVPLIEDLPWVQSLSAELGFRYSDYNLSGAQNTWKAGLNYRPISQVKLRGGFNRAVRAANVVELFRPQANGLWNGSDPCAGANPLYSAAQCARTGVSASQYGSVTANPVGQFNQLTGGNPQLDPETADTITLGLVLSPLDRMNITLDYWDIKIEDVIGTVGASTALNQCALTGEASLCSLIRRAPDGNLWLDLLSGSGGYIMATNANLGSWHYRGVDLSMDYSLPFGPGDVKFSVNGSRFLKKFRENVKGLAGSRFSCEGLYSANCNFPTPKWRHTFGATYASDSFWSTTVSWRYYGAVDNPAVTTGIDSGINAQNFFDLSGTFQVADNVSVVAGVNNVLDKEPPLVSLNISTNYFNTVDGYYDMLGRFLHLSATVKF